MFRSTFRSPNHNFKLYYFPLRGRAEYIRIMLNYLNVDFEDVRVRKDEWNTFKSRTPMGCMPVLDIENGSVLCQSTAIGRYIAKEYGLAGDGNIEMARADMLVDCISDVWGQLQTVYQVQQKGDIQLMIESWARFYDQHLKVFLERCQEIVRESKSGFLIGKGVTWADFALAEFLSVLRDCFTADALDSFQSLISYMDRMNTLPNVKDYLTKRQRTPF